MHGRIAAWVGLCLSAGQLCRATDLSTQSAQTELDSEPKLEHWIQNYQLRAGVGYKDNVLLSSSHEQESAFLTSGLDLFFLRVPIDGRQFYFLFSGDDTRYLAEGAPPKEQTFLASAKFEQTFRETWKAGASANYLYQDQVFDVSVTENELSSIKLQAHNVSLRPFVRHELPHRFWAELECGAIRQEFARPLDDYREVGPKLIWGWQYGAQSKLGMSYEWLNRAYDERNQRTTAGDRISNTALEFERQTVEGFWHHDWDTARRWRSVTRASFAGNRDNGPGYYDYERIGLSHQLRFVAETWELKASARLDEYRFRHQRARDTGGARRRETVSSLGFRAEKTVKKVFKVFANYEYALSAANRDADEYQANTVSFGVSWDWD